MLPLKTLWGKESISTHNSFILKHLLKFLKVKVNYLKVSVVLSLFCCNVLISFLSTFFGKFNVNEKTMPKIFTSICKHTDVLSCVFLKAGKCLFGIKEVSWYVFQWCLKTGNEWIYRTIMKCVGEGEGWIICNRFFNVISNLFMSHDPNSWIWFTNLICVHNRHNMFFYLSKSVYIFFVFSKMNVLWMVYAFKLSSKFQNGHRPNCVF